MPRRDARNVRPSLSDDPQDKLLAALNWPYGKQRGNTTYERAPMYFDACREWHDGLSEDDQETCRTLADVIGSVHKDAAQAWPRRCRRRRGVRSSLDGGKAMNLTRLLFLSSLSLISIPSLAAEELADNRLVVQAKVPRAGDFIGFDFDSLWMVTSTGELARINAADNSVIDINLEGTIGKYRGIATGEGAVWIPDVGADKVYKVDPSNNRVISTFPTSLSDSEGSIGVGEGAVWITTADDNDKTLVRYNAMTGAPQAVIALPGASIGVVAGFGSIWVTSYQRGELYRIDPRTNAIAMTIKLHEGPRFITSGDGSIWVLNQGDGTVQRIDGESGELLATVETGLSAGSGGDIVCGGGYVWVSLPGVPVAQIDPKTNSLVRVFKGWNFGDGIRYGDGSLWLSGPVINRLEPPP